jgi:hypothetical protein
MFPDSLRQILISSISFRRLVLHFNEIIVIFLVTSLLQAIDLVSRADIMFCSKLCSSLLSMNISGWFELFFFFVDFYIMKLPSHFYCRLLLSFSIKIFSWLWNIRFHQRLYNYIYLCTNHFYYNLIENQIIERDWNGWW